MTREEREAAIAYIKGYRKLDEDLHNTAPKDSISYYATDKCLKYWDMAIQALSQEPTEKPMTVDEMEREYEKSKALFHKIVECEDAISRQAVKELIKSGVSTDTYDDVEQVCKWIDALPSVTQKSGKWIDDEFGSKCSCCGIHTHLDKFDRPMKFKYCSMCGAKMESEK